MKIILHGVLAERFGREFEIMTNVPAEAIEGLSRQLPDWPRDLALDVVGFEDEADLYKATATREIHLVPSMFGGSGVVKIIIGAALIAAVFLLPEIGVPLAAWLSSAMFATGVTLALTGISELMMKQPTVANGGPADPPASKYFGVNKNTTAIGTLITLAWGRVLLGGHWLSLQANSSAMVTTNFPATTS